MEFVLITAPDGDLQTAEFVKDSNGKNIVFTNPIEAHKEGWRKGFGMYPNYEIYEYRDAISFINYVIEVKAFTWQYFGDAFPDSVMQAYIDTADRVCDESNEEFIQQTTEILSETEWFAENAAPIVVRFQSGLFTQEQTKKAFAELGLYVDFHNGEIGSVCPLIFIG